MKLSMGKFSMDERQREFAERLSAAGVEITEELDGVDEPRRENLLDFMLRQERKAARIRKRLSRRIAHRLF